MIKPEFSYGHSRFDFFLANERESCLLEVKSSTLVKDGVAMFPDAVTERGRRHVNELVKEKRKATEHAYFFLFKELTHTHLLRATKLTPNLERYYERLPMKGWKFTFNKRKSQTTSLALPFLPD